MRDAAERHSTVMGLAPVFRKLVVTGHAQQLNEAYSLTLSPHGHPYLSIYLSINRSSSFLHEPCVSISTRTWCWYRVT